MSIALGTMVPYYGRRYGGPKWHRVAVDGVSMKPNHEATIHYRLVSNERCGIEVDVTAATLDKMLATPVDVARAKRFCKRCFPPRFWVRRVGS